MCISYSHSMSAEGQQGLSLASSSLQNLVDGTDNIWNIWNCHCGWPSECRHWPFIGNKMLQPRRDTCHISSELSLQNKSHVPKQARGAGKDHPATDLADPYGRKDTDALFYGGTVRVRPEHTWSRGVRSVLHRIWSSWCSCEMAFIKKWFHDAETVARRSSLTWLRPFRLWQGV